MTAEALKTTGPSGWLKTIGRTAAECWQFIAKPFTPAAWQAEYRQLSTLGPQGAGKAFLKALPKLAAYYILLAPIVAMPFYNSLLFHPFAAGNYNLIAINGVRCQNIFFPAQNGKQLHAWLFQLPGATKTVLLSHGNAGNLTDRAGLASILLKSGASVFMYDYQGFGKSKGGVSLEGFCLDATAAYKYLVQTRGIKSSDIILFGESIGTGATCALAAKERSGGIILQSAFTSLPTIAREKLKFLRLYPDCLFPSTKLDNLAALKQPHPPLLLVHGVKDELISIGHSEQLFQQTAEPKSFTRLPNAGHNDIGYVDAAQYKQALTQFIASLQ